jgi:hypothetical protein
MWSRDPWQDPETISWGLCEVKTIFYNTKYRMEFSRAHLMADGMCTYILCLKTLSVLISKTKY